MNCNRFYVFDHHAQESIKLAFVGDLMFSRDVGRVAKSMGYNLFIQHIYECLEKHDLVIGNLETAITLSDKKNPFSVNNFKSSPSVLSALSCFSLLTLANNHIFDYCEEGIHDTVKYLKETGIHYIGVGRTMEEADAPFVFYKIGFFNFTSLKNIHFGSSWEIAYLPNYYSLKRMFLKFREKQDGKVIVSLIHFGYEGIPFPSIEARKQAKMLIDAGSDIVVGTHPHVIQGYELYKNKLILYSLGDFVFDGKEPLRNISAIFSIEIGKNYEISSLSLIPVKTNDLYQVYPASPSEGQKTFTYFLSLSQEIMNGKSDKLFLSAASKGFFSNQIRSLKLTFSKSGIRGLLKKISRIRPLHVKLMLRRKWWKN